MPEPDPWVQGSGFGFLLPCGSTAISGIAQVSNRGTPEETPWPLAAWHSRFLGACDFRRREVPSFLLCVFV